MDNYKECPMVKIKSGGTTGEQGISKLRVQRQFTRLEQAYAEHERRNVLIVNSDVVPNGDPSPLILWGEE